MVGYQTFSKTLVEYINDVLSVEIWWWWWW